MRIRLKNEISFARGDEAIGGGSSEEAVAAYKKAIEMIERRLHELASLGEARNLGVAAAGPPEAISGDDGLGLSSRQELGLHVRNPNNAIHTGSRIANRASLTRFGFHQSGHCTNSLHGCTLCRYRS